MTPTAKDLDQLRKFILRKRKTFRRLSDESPNEPGAWDGAIVALSDVLGEMSRMRRERRKKEKAKK